MGKSQPPQKDQCSARIWDMEKTESLQEDKDIESLYRITSVLG